MRVTSIEYFFNDTEEALAFAKANDLTCSIRINLRNGVICGGANLSTPRQIDTANGIIAESPHDRGRGGEGDKPSREYSGSTTAASPLTNL